MYGALRHTIVCEERLMERLELEEWWDQEADNENQSIILIIWWSQNALCEYLLVFFIFCDGKLGVFRTNVHAKQTIQILKALKNYYFSLF